MSAAVHNISFTLKLISSVHQPCPETAHLPPKLCHTFSFFSQAASTWSSSWVRHRVRNKPDPQVMSWHLPTEIDQHQRHLMAPGGRQGYIFALVLPTMGFEGCGRTLKLELTCHTGSTTIWNVQDLVDHIMYLTKYVASSNVLEQQKCNNCSNVR